MDTYGYVRVSAKEQNEDRRIIVMRGFGVADSRIVLGKRSGTDFKRPGCRRLVRKLKAGAITGAAGQKNVGYRRLPSTV